MRSSVANFALFCVSCTTLPCAAELTEKVVDIPTRPEVTQRILLITPEAPKAALILFAGGHGGLQIQPEGKLTWGDGNFVIRTRQQYAAQGFMVAVIDAPSDRQSPPFLSGFRMTSEHLADIRGVISWLRQQTPVPIWLLGTSRGTQSVAHAATQLTGDDAPNGIVLTSSILTDKTSVPVTELPLENVRTPVLVVHHENDGCKLCPYSETANLMKKLNNSSRKKLLTFRGGEPQGDPCKAHAYHGFNGIENDVVEQISQWVLEK